MPEPILVSIVAGCVIHKDGKYLLLQEKQAKAYGLWNLPAGRVDQGESIEDAAVREAKEESGIDVELGERVSLHHATANESVKHAFDSKIISGDLKIQEDEIMDAQWLTLEEVRSLYNDGKLRSPWVLEAIEAVARK